MLNSYKINKTHHEVPSFVIPEQIINELSLKEGQPINLNCGSLLAEAKVVTSRSQGRVGLSEGVFNALKLPDNLSLSIKVNGNESFQLGPVIGILTFTHNIKHRDFKRYIPYARKVNENGFLYVFGPSDTNPTTKTVRGYHFDFKKGSWQSGEFAYPDVVIDRIYPTNSDIHAELEKIIGQNKIFNKHNLIDKMNFFKAMDNDSLLKKYVPETAYFLRPAQLEHFIRKHEGVFLKPVDSMKGRGIVYVFAEGAAVICKYMNNHKPISKTLTQPQQIIDVLERANKQKRSYIIQAAVKRTEYQGRPFNFRTMVVKNGSGQWLVPAVFAKIAEPEGFLTNNSSGASFILLKDLFKLIENKFPLSKSQCVDLLIDLSLKTAQVLDKRFGPLGKIGLDLVVDPSGKPWLIEANGNPGIMLRNTLNEYPDWSSQMYDYPLAYGFYLAGFGNKGFDVKK